MTVIWYTNNYLNPSIGYEQIDTVRKLWRFGLTTPIRFVLGPVRSVDRESKNTLRIRFRHAPAEQDDMSAGDGLQPDAVLLNSRAHGGVSLEHEGPARSAGLLAGIRHTVDL